MKRYREFLPAVLEVQDTPPSPAGRGIIWCVMLTMSAALLWAAWGKVDIVAVTQGKIVVSELSRPVNAAVTAEVAAVMVREGMHVAQGQPLIKFNDGHLQAQIKENRLRQRINRFHIARLTLLNRYYHQGSVTAQLPPAYLQEDVALAEQAALRLTAEIEADRREKAVFDSRRAVLLAQLAEGQVEKALAENLLPLFREQYQALEALYQKKLTSRDSLLESGKKYTESRHRVVAAETRAQEVRDSLHQIDEEAQARTADKTHALAKESAERSDENRVLETQLNQLQSLSAQYLLRAPVSGTVESLVFRDAGGAVEPAQELLKIVPDSGERVAEVMVRNQDVGFLRPGQKAAVKISTFDFTRYGWVTGELRQVSADAVEDRELGLVYRAVISLKRRTLLVEGEEKLLEPGMQVTGEIKTGRRTILSYLLSPVMEALDGVGKQR
ncbi:HlyD family secretion protein [Raoultella planticola]|uniref:Membrane fusion protein (MFP) family protein n=1 Tax=Raoultella planticola TaxID=575 RepID=A0A443VI31_RAOPL|nr:HlyD family type I secretion periplasmic adaptor subunit [Raoultella planticola]ATM05925.1 HlyD family secretion protein [Raoultella planticola]ATM16865.1 HlyD family secretion protein [Raoultella planticola]AUV54008.1 HlyD family secretion protein [Raoultella planticola]EKW3527554.1 HlyD family type I secretion periplasmic adaptor subunit [Raoultella planticola]ELC3573828.1 HlyD family type I secretion periplasmic adaptor subunit [Raoultella planticola]